MLCWQAWQQSDSFKQLHLPLATTSVTSAIEDLNTLFSELQRSMRLFADDQQSLFR
jgi:hypothetical protein